MAAPRSFWKGYLKLSLVTCPVAMLPATSESEKVRFHTLNRRSGNRVVSQYLDSASGRAVADDAIVKGYPRGEDDFVMLEDEELDSVALESTRTIEIERFVPADSIGWIWYDKPHYLMPDDAVGEEAFCVIRDAMAASGRAGLARLVLYRRERAVLLRPRGKGIVVWTLHYGEEVRPAEDYYPALPKGRPDSRLLALVKSLIEERTQPWTPALVQDPVQQALLSLIRAKKRGRKRGATPKRKAAAATPDNVIDIREALRRSLAGEKRKRR